MKLKTLIQYLYDRTEVQLILIKGKSPFPAVITYAFKVHIQYPNLLNYNIGKIYNNGFALNIELMENQSKTKEKKIID
jgi:hypothetical protein